MQNNMQPLFQDDASRLQLIRRIKVRGLSNQLQHNKKRHGLVYQKQCPCQLKLLWANQGLTPSSSQSTKAESPRVTNCKTREECKTKERGSQVVYVDGCFWGALLQIAALVQGWTRWNPILYKLRNPMHATFLQILSIMRGDLCVTLFHFAQTWVNFNTLYKSVVKHRCVLTRLNCGVIVFSFGEWLYVK